MYKRYETFEDFILSGTTFYFMLTEIAVAFIINVEHERLEMVSGYLVPETVFTVVIYRCCGSYQSVDGSGIFLGENVARLFFDEPENIGSNRMQASMNISFGNSKNEAVKSLLQPLMQIMVPGRSTTCVFLQFHNPSNRLWRVPIPYGKSKWHLLPTSINDA